MEQTSAALPPHSWIRRHRRIITISTTAPTTEASNSTNTVVIDETFTYSFANGRVAITRNGQPWLEGHFEGSGAWIAAAGRIEQLEERVAQLEAHIEDNASRTRFGLIAEIMEGDGF